MRLSREFSRPIPKGFRAGPFGALVFLPVLVGFVLLSEIATGASLGHRSPLPARQSGSVSGIGSETVGCGEKCVRVKKLRIRSSGIYEDFLVDGEWQDRTLVRITADNVVLRNCEIRNGTHNGIEVYGSHVLIDSCRIHSLLKGTFNDQKDAHGITGAPTDLTIRNTEIHHVSGDAVQFDPGREPWDNVFIENSTFWTGPLKQRTKGFRKGQTPGENAVDTKQFRRNPRSRLTIRNSLFHGWKDGPISNMSALNLKNHVWVQVHSSLLADNDIAVRARGGDGERGGAIVSISNTAIYRSRVALRLEDKLKDLHLCNVGFGPNIKLRYQKAKAGSPMFTISLGQVSAISTELELLEMGKAKPLSAGLRRFLEDKDVLLPATAKIVRVKPLLWVIKDKTSPQKLKIRQEPDSLVVYGLAGYRNIGEYAAPALEQVLSTGLKDLPCQD